jgi:sporulation protein YlmC with PRC-barrel domain
LPVLSQVTTEMAPDTDTRTPGRPVSDLTDTPVYTRDGYRLGRVAGVAVNVDAERASGVLVADVREERFPELQTGRRGVRVPYDRVGGVGDVVVVDVPGSAFGAPPAAEANAADLSEALADARRRRRRMRTR